MSFLPIFLIIITILSCQTKEKETLYFGGRILTMDGKSPAYIEAVVEKDGKTIFTGEKKEAFKKYPDANRVNLEGKAMLPSFLDSHGHFVAAIDEVIEATKFSGIDASNDRRFVVIHSQFQRPDQLDEYVKLGLTPSYFTNHTFFWGDVHIKNIGKSKASFISPIKAAVDKGLIYSNHSDFNITPLDPFFILWTATTRKTREGVILGEEQRVDMYTALQGLTTGPAYQVFEEERKGKIKVGFLADYVILDKDPMRITGDEIKDIQVIETIKNGKVVYSKN